VIRIERDPRTERDLKRTVPLAELYLRDIPTQLIDNLGNCITVASLEDGNELLSPVPADDIRLTQSLTQKLRNPSDDAVPREVAVSVVHNLKMIDIYHDKCHG